MQCSFSRKRFLCQATFILTALCQGNRSRLKNCLCNADSHKSPEESHHFRGCLLQMLFVQQPKQEVNDRNSCNRFGWSAYFFSIHKNGIKMGILFLWRNSFISRAHCFVHESILWIYVLHQTIYFIVNWFWCP